MLAPPAFFATAEVPLPQSWVLRLLANDGILHYRITEVVNNRGDGKYAPQPRVQAWLMPGGAGVRHQCRRARDTARARRAGTRNSARPRLRVTGQQGSGRLVDLAAAPEPVLALICQDGLAG
jgi:hypothetical protein